MDQGKRAGFQRLVQASLLVDEASNESNRAARRAAKAAHPIARLAAGIDELEQLAAVLRVLSGTSPATDGDLPGRLATAGAIAERLAGAFRTEAADAQREIEHLLATVEKSSECTQQAAKLLTVA